MVWPFGQFVELQRLRLRRDDADGLSQFACVAELAVVIEIYIDAYAGPIRQPRNVERHDRACLRREFGSLERNDGSGIAAAGGSLRSHDAVLSRVAQREIDAG